MLKRSGILLLAALFGFATLQSASADDEDEDDHTVTIDVEEITELELDGGDAQLDFEETGDTEQFDGQFDGAFASDTDESTDLTLSTNENSSGDLKIDGTFEYDSDSPDISELGLHVHFDETGGSDLDGGEQVTELNNNFTGGERNLTIVEFEDNHDDAEIEITYEGAITEDFSPDDDGDIEVTYTVTEE